MYQHQIRLTDCTIHAVDTGPRGTGLPFIYVPGVAGTAEDGVFFFDAFPERRCISLSMRGRGQSSTPDKSYSIRDHALDIAGILKNLGIETSRFHLHGYSISVMYVLSFLLLDEQSPATVILGDHSANVEKLPPGWANQFSSMCMNGRPILDSIRMQALTKIEDDSQDQSLFDNLGALGWDNPVLLLYGNRIGPVPSKISNHEIQEYKRVFKGLHLQKFGESGHFFRDTQRGLYLSAIRSFIAKFDVT